MAARPTCWTGNRSRLFTLRRNRFDAVLEPLLARVPTEIPPGMNVVTAGAETASLCANRTVTHKGESLTFGEFLERVRPEAGNVFEDVKIRGVSLRQLLHGNTHRKPAAVLHHPHLEALAPRGARVVKAAPQNALC